MRASFLPTSSLGRTGVGYKQRLSQRDQGLPRPNRGHSYADPARTKDIPLASTVHTREGTAGRAASAKNTRPAMSGGSAPSLVRALAARLTGEEDGYLASKMATTTSRENP
jgi:hypothetical protein